MTNHTAPNSLFNFASDNWAPVHPAIMRAIERANTGAVPAYGDDDLTAGAVALIREHFGESAEPHFVFTGTAANVLSLESCVRPYEAVICSDVAHIQTSEWGAVQRNIGSRVLPVHTSDGKLTVDGILTCIASMTGHAGARPRAVSLTQATEYGTVYTPEELRSITEVAHARSMYVHMDGARLANAAASLGVSLAEASTACGVDVLSFGATKNGAMCAEAVIFMNADIARDFDLRRKQGMQLASKLRYMSVQFTAILTDDLWRTNAAHANAMASRLAGGLRRIPGVTVTQTVQANEVFALIPRNAVDSLHEVATFHMWDEARGEVRLVCAFDTPVEGVDAFVGCVRQAVTG